jgi:uncharacterized protein
MQKVRLGKSGLEVTKVGFGGIPIQRITEEEAIKVVRRALDLGVDWIDTANGYGTSEERIGKAVGPYDRNSFKLFTKSHPTTAAEAKEQLQLSFDRLRVDHIDLYQFHCINTIEEWDLMQQNGIVDVIAEAKKRGRIGHIGLSSHYLGAMLSILDSEIIEIIQWPFNFIVKSQGLEVIEKCKANDVGFIGMKPFGGGMLDHARACIRFLMQYPTVAIDPGIETVEEIEEVVSLAKANESLSEEERGYIERMKQELGTKFCRRCGYCSPCPQGVSIIALMTMESLIKRMPAEQIASGWIAEAGESFANCNRCGQCEPKCPYNLPIRKQICQGFEMFQKVLKEN